MEEAFKIIANLTIHFCLTFVCWNKNYSTEGSLQTVNVVQVVEWVCCEDKALNLKLLLTTGMATLLLLVCNESYTVKSCEELKKY